MKNSAAPIYMYYYFLNVFDTSKLVEMQAISISCDVSMHFGKLRHNSVRIGNVGCIPLAVVMTKTANVMNTAFSETHRIHFDPFRPFTIFTDFSQILPKSVKPLSF